MQEKQPATQGNTAEAGAKPAEQKLTLDNISKDALSKRIAESILTRTDIMSRVENKNTAPGDLIVERISITLDTAPTTDLAIEIRSDKANFLSEFTKQIDEKIRELNLTYPTYNVKRLVSDFAVIEENTKNLARNEQKDKTFSYRSLIY